MSAIDPVRASPAARVLIVDDQPENLDLLEEVLLFEGYEVTRAVDGAAALDAVREAPPDCIVLDVMMPVMDGFSVCRTLKSSRRTCFIPIVILTALTEVTDRVLGLNLGADDFLNKPVNQAEFLARVRSLVRIRRLREELETSENIIFSLIRALESKDPLSLGHSERVAASALRVARALRLAPPEIESTVRGALLHDIGKIGVPEALLVRGQPLSDAERHELRKHPELGEKILDPLLSFAAIRETVRHHHERLDGSGFPDGLSGPDLGLATEIVALANHFDDLVRDDPNGARSSLREAATRGEFRRDSAEALLQEDETLPIRPGAPTPSWDDLLPVPTGAQKGRLVVGVDRRANREVLEEILATAGHQVRFVDTAVGVLEAVRMSKPDLVLLDLRGSSPDPFTLCEAIKSGRDAEFLPVLVAMDWAEVPTRTRAVEAGVDDLLMLPIDRLELIARVKSLLRLRLYFRDLEEHQSVVLSLGSALEAKDRYTQGHSERVGLLAGRLGRELGLSEEACHELKVAGLLHDIGKIGVPERLLNKTSRLTEEEFRTILTHPDRGAGICRPLRSLTSVLPLIRHHHERFDGRGYPDHLAGDRIPLGARVLAMADAYDALTSDRSYRKRLAPDEALSVLSGERDQGHWDPSVFAALEAMVRRERG